MKKLIGKLHRSIIMGETKLPVWMLGIVMGVSNYVLYPDFRRRNYSPIKFIKRAIIGTFIYGFAMLVILSIVDRQKLQQKDLAIQNETRKVKFLNDEARRFMYEQVEDSVRNSEDYLRYQIFLKSGEVIPKNKMSAEQMKVVTETAENKNIPLSIYVRVIKHESDFDSTAVNPASGAFGYMQLLPSTWRGLSSVMNLTGRTAENNLLAGGYFLSTEFKYWTRHGRNKKDAWEMALASYAVGDSLTVAMQRVPESAQPYVDFVMKTYGTN